MQTPKATVLLALIGIGVTVGMIMLWGSLGVRLSAPLITVSGLVGFLCAVGLRPTRDAKPRKQPTVLDG